jgi:hypothetical protein
LRHDGANGNGIMDASDRRSEAILSQPDNQPG